MSYRSERRRYERRRRSNIGCLTWMVALVWIVLLAMLGYRFLLRDQVSQAVGERIGDRVGGISTPADQQIQDGIEAVAPGIVAALPSGEVRISETQANDYLAGNSGSLGVIDSMTVRFVPGQIQADVQAVGITSTGTMGVAVQDGRVIAVDPQISGPLGQVLSASTLAASFEQQINAQLAAQGRRIQEARVEQGELVLVVEG